MTDGPDKKDEENFKFTAEGEALGYIGMEQAQVRAMQVATETPGDYGAAYSGIPMAFDVARSEDREDHYVVTLSFRPQGDFCGRPGQEQFFIEKEGTVAHRQVLALPRAGRGIPVVPVAIGLAVAGAVAVVAVFAVGGFDGGDDIQPVAAASSPTRTPIPTAIAPTRAATTPVALPAAVGQATDIPEPTAIITPAPIPTPVSTAISTPTPLPAPTNTPTALRAPTAMPTAPVTTAEFSSIDGPTDVARLINKPWQPSRLTVESEKQVAPRSEIANLLSLAQEDAWRESIGWLAGSPDGSMLYAGTANGPYKSSDGGLTWSPTQLPYTEVPIRFDPDNDRVMYGVANVTGVNRGLKCTDASQKGGYGILCLWRSVDGGESYVFLESPLGNHQSLAVSSDFLYLTRSNMLFRSPDRGETWREVNSGGAGGSDRLFVVPRHPSILYWRAGSSRVSGKQSSLGLFMSKDAGLSWTPVLEDGRPKSVETVSGVSDIAFDSAQPPNVYVSLGNQFWKGNAMDPRDWSVIDARDAVGGGAQFAVQPGNTEVMAILSGNIPGKSSAEGAGLFASFDGGKSWVPLHEAGYQLGNVVYEGLPPGARWLVVSGGSPWTICMGSAIGVWCHRGVTP